MLFFQLLVYILLCFLLLLLLSIFLHLMKTVCCRKRLCFIVFRRVGEYISPDLFYFRSYVVSLAMLYEVVNRHNCCCQEPRASISGHQIEKRTQQHLHCDGVSPQVVTTAPCPTLQVGAAVSEFGNTVQKTASALS